MRYETCHIVHNSCKQLGRVSDAFVDCNIHKGYNRHVTKVSRNLRLWDVTKMKPQTLTPIL